MKSNWRHFANGFALGVMWTVVFVAVLGLLWLCVSDLMEVFS